MYTLHLYHILFLNSGHGNHAGRFTYAHGLHGYVGAPARVAPLGKYSYYLSGTFFDIYIYIYTHVYTHIL